MITKDNISQLLDFLGFSQRKGIFSKTFGAATLSVDTAKEAIIYPEAQGLIINERQTCNFSANENFVVFECVHRLLEKGYKPEHIELEPKWKLGHGASGGRADILIKGNAEKPLLIIECKTPGNEFKKEWNNTKQDGGQLFSYAQQIPETQFLCLYASDFDGAAVTYQSNIIAYRDNGKYLADNPSLKGFKEPGDAKFKFTIWRDTYKLDYTTKGIFEPNIQPYHIGKDKYTIADLQAIYADDQQKKYHEFATILRQHNVSGRENAFDKLVNLFLCKLVDEQDNQADLKFYWKGVAYDSHYDLMDRLQQLYQSGMEKFLGEDITYIHQDDVKNALRFIRQNPDATQRAVWNLFIQQKFFTNNDFSFIDVHNEKLFYQNADVLLKVLQMWQDIRLTNPHGHHQFLGDMFEGFLDQGVKQSEGQYFTPMPICRFILMSLPLANMVAESATPPKAIDYACGAGHFLNELALQLKPLIEQKQGDPADYFKQIYGMEKEYRLSKVAKVSAFMYGQQEINICYGDALVKQHAAFPEIRDNSFDLLVANPPFSVRGFLETLPEEERAAYSLTDAIDKLDTNNSIETFFIERAKQLLKAGGVAGLILPASVLSNGGRVYTRAREVLLQYFDIVAIAEFGSGTFGKTGTNTVTLFLRRKATAPDTADHYRERVDEWFSSDDNQGVYQDAHLIDQYATHIGVTPADYKTLLTGASNAALLAHDTFVQYRTAFDSNTEITNLKKQKGFKAKTKAEQDAELAKRFLAFVQSIERDKLFHFVLAAQQPNQVLIIKSPTDSKAQKRFLGYEWSSAKGDEGIKLVKDTQGHHVTLLYDETNRDNAAKLNRCIAENFDGRLAVLPEELGEFAATARLVDMLDFSRVTFEKQVALTAKSTITLQSKWPLVKMKQVVSINPNSLNPFELFGDSNFVYIDISSIESDTGIVSYSQQITPSEAPSRARREVLNDDVILSTVRPNLKAFAVLKNLPERVLASTGFAVLRANCSLVLPKYIFEMLFSDTLQEQMVSKMGKGQYPSINQTDIESLQFPLPPLKIQQQIVAECEAVDAETTAAQVEIQRANDEIAAIVSRVSAPMQKLSDITSKIGSGATPRGGESSYKETGITLIRSQNIYDDCFKEKGLAFIDEEQAKLLENVTVEANDVLFNITGASVARCYVADAKYLPARVNQHVAIIRPNKDVHYKYLHRILVSPLYKAKLLELAAGSLSREAITKTQLEEFKVPVPPLAEQKRLVAAVEKLEKQIAEAQTVIAAAPARKQAIMQRYL